VQPLSVFCPDPQTPFCDGRIDRSRIEQDRTRIRDRTKASCRNQERDREQDSSRWGWEQDARV
jgi:hypothetical protein